MAYSDQTEFPRKITTVSGIGTTEVYATGSGDHRISHIVLSPISNASTFTLTGDGGVIGLFELQGGILTTIFKDGILVNGLLQVAIDANAGNNVVIFEHDD